MRLLHTSDWHVGRVLHEHPLLPAQERVFDGLVRLLESDPHDALVVAGDVFDRSVPPEDAVHLFGDVLRKLREACPRMAIVVIAGNHDSAARLAWASDLLELGGVHVRGPLDKLDKPVRLKTDGGDAQLWPIPFLWGGAMADHADGQDTPTASQAAALGQALHRVRSLGDDALPQVVVAHCFVSGGATCESERTLVGEATQVDGGLFDGFDYAALGHLHGCQRVGPQAWYSGSPLKYSFSEARHDKSFLSVVLGEDGDPPEVRRLPVPQPREMAILRGTLEELLDGPEHVAAADHFVRIELTEPPARVPHALLRGRFPLLLDLRVPEAGGSSVRVRQGGPSRDLEQDFLEFQRHLHGEPPGESLVRAFRLLREAAERGGPA